MGIATEYNCRGGWTTFSFASTAWVRPPAVHVDIRARTEMKWHDGGSVFDHHRSWAAGSILALLRARYLIQAQPYSLLSAPEKRDEIRKWQAMTGYRLFVETGTFLGETTLAMSGIFERCWTVEIDKSLYEQALVRFNGRQNITALHGDSGTRMVDILKEIDAPAIFWLDGHYSKANTGRGTRDTPIVHELMQIFEHPIRQHVILIDDARTFLGRNGYPTIKSLHRFVRARSPYRMRIANDIIRLHTEAL
jgi:hypothetical protein